MRSKLSHVCFSASSLRHLLRFQLFGESFSPHSSSLLIGCFLFTRLASCAQVQADGFCNARPCSDHFNIPARWRYFVFAFSLKCWMLAGGVVLYFAGGVCWFKLFKSQVFAIITQVFCFSVCLSISLYPYKYLARIIESKTSVRSEI